MIPRQKEAAEIIRIGLVGGFRTVADAIRWADDVVAADSDPDPAIIEVALAGELSSAEVVSRLSVVAGTADATTVWRAVFADILRTVDADHSRGEAIAHWLYSSTRNRELPEETFGSEPLFLEDYFAGAREGWGGTYDEAFRELRAYLAREASRPEA